MIDENDMNEKPTVESQEHIVSKTTIHEAKSRPTVEDEGQSPIEMESLIARAPFPFWFGVASAIWIICGAISILTSLRLFDVLSDSDALESTHHRRELSYWGLYVGNIVVGILGFVSIRTGIRGFRGKIADTFIDGLASVFFAAFVYAVWELHGRQRIYDDVSPMLFGIIAIGYLAAGLLAIQCRASMQMWILSEQYILNSEMPLTLVTAKRDTDVVGTPGSYPKKLYITGVIWIVYGGLAILIGMLGLVVLLAQIGEPYLRGASKVPIVVDIAATVFAGSCGLYMLLSGIRVVRGEVNDIIIPNINSFVFAVFLIVVGLAVSIAHDTDRSALVVFGTWAVILGIASAIALVARDDYVRWYEAQRRHRMKMRRIAENL